MVDEPDTPEDSSQTRTIEDVLAELERMGLESVNAPPDISKKEEEGETHETAAKEVPTYKGHETGATRCMKKVRVSVTHIH